MLQLKNRMPSSGKITEPNKSYFVNYIKPLFMLVYIYIYICVCVCVCAVEISNLNFPQDDGFLYLSLTHSMFKIYINIKQNLAVMTLTPHFVYPDHIEMTLLKAKRWFTAQKMKPIYFTEKFVQG
jgi:hypothetical protein